MNKSAVIVLGLAFIFLATGMTGSTELRTCQSCQGIIEGVYIKAETFYFHPEHLYCFDCRKPIRKQTYFFDIGQFYDNDCFEKRNRLNCDFCIKEISSEYVVYKKKKYHPFCFENDVATKCALCNKGIRGMLLTDTWGNTFHAEHNGISSQCDYCATFFTNSGERRGFRYEDGRKICNRCKKNAVSDNEAMKNIALEVIRHLRNLDFHVTLSSTELVLVNSDKMHDMDRTAGHNRLGLTDYQASRDSWGRTIEQEITIYMLSGMPRILAISTLAHELMHVWQITNGQIDSDPIINEGSCNYASLLVLQNYEGIEAEQQIQNLLTDDSPVYGVGLRRVKNFVETNGMTAWVDLMLSDPHLLR